MTLEETYIDTQYAPTRRDAAAEPVQRAELRPEPLYRIADALERLAALAETVFAPEVVAAEPEPALQSKEIVPTLNRCDFIWVEGSAEHRCSRFSNAHTQHRCDCGAKTEEPDAV